MFPPRLSSATCLSSGRTAVTCLMLHAVPSLCLEDDGSLFFRFKLIAEYLMLVFSKY